MIRLALRVRRDEAERILADLIELAPDGFEEVDVDAEVLEYALYGSAEALPEPAQLRAAAGDALVSLETSEVADDWSQRWREFHQPLRLGGRLEVRPPWIDPAGAEIDLVIDPGQAFGTGAHATTALCLELLLERELPTGERSVLDLGCGSGVLAILAARLGWEPVLALDHDPLAVAATRENAAVNGVALAGVGCLDLTREPVPPARLVLANLLAPLLSRWCEAGVEADWVIASGLLVREADAISAAFARVGFAEIERRCQGDWAALMLGSRFL